VALIQLAFITVELQLSCAKLSIGQMGSLLGQM